MLFTHLTILFMASMAMAGHRSCKKQGLSRCHRKCVDLTTDVKNCGACRVKCSEGDTCDNGVCTPPPPPQCTTGSQCGNPINCGPDGANCFCVTGTSGGTACAYEAGCTDCALDSDCVAEANGYCEIGSCCPVGACFYGRDTCANPQARREIFSGSKSVFNP